MFRAVEAGEVSADYGIDDQIVDLPDSTMVESSPHVARLLATLRERGWRGWTRIKRGPGEKLNAELPPS
ncbi:hypothetical protein ACWDYK_18935 [Streptomyces anthocyanicus]|uniref:Transcriptional regulator, MerR family n=1 Tax=Streptomyces lividans 1326 TaxID=1200984 RepID=A0A7U9H934_STRLI|nr:MULTISPECIES: hypothetical protein [Streptomyces]EOY45594.1 Transcriptional regulator, MerR family [Streptomyces lividans 1326]KKD13904.1 hypothetical protein TR66_18045 [Streptomyces sp. WM6391]